MNKNRERKLWAVALVSLLVWMTAAVQGRIPAQRVQMFVGAQDTKRIREEKAPDGGLYQLAWWGSLYPRTCLESAMRLVEEPEEEIRQEEKPEGKEAQLEDISEGKKSRTEESPEEKEAQPEEEKESRQEPGENLPVRIRWKCMDLF